MRTGFRIAACSLVLLLAQASPVPLVARSAASAARPQAATAAPAQTIAVPGLAQPVDILIDRWGVPHIYAANEADLFFAQGFNVARDRLFQIDLWRRRGLGRLAEVFGPAYVDQDRAARLFLFRGDMAKEWAAYGDDAARVARSFADGINAYIGWLEQHPDRLPLEFKRFGYAPARWAAEDVVRIRSHGLMSNLASEVARAKVACAGSVQADEMRRSLQPAWQVQVPAGLDPCLPDGVLRVYDLATQAVRLAPDASRPSQPAAAAAGDEIVPGDEDPQASNNWTIAPAKTTTGRPIVANDPHRAYGAPSLRYIVDLNAPTLHAEGANEPALPGISLGHNDWVAFGYTIFAIDESDLYVYELKPDEATQYRYGDGWERIRVVREAIDVKGGAPVQAELAFTRHGPIVFTDAQKHRAYAVRTAWLEPGTSPYFVSLRYLRARSGDEYEKALEHWGTPPLNHVYADVKGNIGWAPGGFAPVRPNWDGLLPVPGDGRFEWAGSWSGSQLPRVRNPRSGFFTTSNEMNLPADYPYKERKLGFEWAEPSRHARIEQVLGAPGRVSIEDSMRLQNDVLSVAARRLVAVLAPLSSADADTAAALGLLRAWDGTLTADSAAAALYEVWFARHLGGAFKQAVVDKRAAAAFGAPDAAVMLDALERPERVFGADAAKRRDELLLTSLKAAFVEMKGLGGPEARAWRWGALHHNVCEHPLSPAFDAATRARVDVGPLETGGDGFTPNASSFRPSDFRQTNGPSVRLVMDVGNWDNSRAVNHPGQSGDPDSPHYRDLAPLWQRGEYFPLLYTRDAVEKATEQRIRLVPR